MRSRIAWIALPLAACSGGGGGSGGGTGAVATPTPSPAPTATPPPPPTPAPSASPTPDATPTALPTATPAGYITFSDVYVLRLGAAAVLPSACSARTFAVTSPAAVAATPFGDGLTFRFVITPNVWSVTNVGGFDGRDGDPFAARFPDPLPAQVEVGFSRQAGPEPVRFSITRPAAGDFRFDYVRLGLAWVPIAGVRTQYHCALGIATTPADVAGVTSASYRRTNVIAAADVRDGAGFRAVTPDRSSVAIAADMTARRVTVTLELAGSAAIGTLTGTVPIDAAGRFAGSLAGAGGATGTIGGALFGPGGVEIAAAFSASSPDAANGYVAAGAVFGAR